jgi:hypothetical protein
VRTSSTNGLAWTEGVNNGGTAVIDYQINMKEEGGSYTSITFGITSHSFTVTGLVLGTTYYFTVEARNSVGYSAPSNELSFLHAIVPEAPDAPTTTNSGTDVVIDWSAPSNNGAEITSYQILIRQSDGTTFSEDLTDCNGSATVIVLTTQCTVPISTLTAEPYSLNGGDSVTVKVIATNVKGDSLDSSMGNGATIIAPPDAPINLAEDTGLRTPTSLGLTWEEGVSNGGALVTEYRLSMAE